MSWKRGLVLVGLFSLIINLLMLTVPVYLMQLSDRVLASHSLDTLIMLTLAAVGALAALSLFDIVRRFMLTRIAMKLETGLGGPIFAATVDLNSAGTGTEIQGLRDLGQVRNYLTSSFVPLLFDLPMAPFYIALVFLIHPDLGLITLLGGAILLFFALVNQAVSADPLKAAGEQTMVAMARAQAHTRNADTVRAMGMLAASLRVWGEPASKAMIAQRRAADRNAIVSGLSKLFRLLLQIAILGWGTYLTLQGQTTAGMAIAASIIGARALAPIEGSIEGWRSLVAAREAYDRIKQIMARLSETHERMRLPDPVGQISLEQLSYAAPGTRDLLVKGISLEIPAGTAVAMVGATGAGKSTLARLLVNAIMPVAGAVRLDGADLRHWNAEQLGTAVGYLPQDVELFPGTIAENISRMQEDADPQAIVAAAQFAGVHELILGLKHGYDTLVLAGGAPLSGGQRQRIGLARAFYGQPKFVVLDEPDANLDRTGEAALAGAIVKSQQSGITLVIITQRPAMLRYVDRILILNEGAVETYALRDAVLKAAIEGHGAGTAAPERAAVAQPGPASALRKPAAETEVAAGSDSDQAEAEADAEMARIDQMERRLADAGWQVGRALQSRQSAGNGISSATSAAASGGKLKAEG